jgi:hypothetical protein
MEHDNNQPTNMTTTEILNTLWPLSLTLCAFVLGICVGFAITLGYVEWQNRKYLRNVARWIKPNETPHD